MTRIYQEHELDPLTNKEVKEAVEFAEQNWIRLVEVARLLPRMEEAAQHAHRYYLGMYSYLQTRVGKDGILRC